MPQIQKGETFADGQQVTGARLNQLIDSATILPNIITDQTNIAVNGVASNDSLLVYDLSATALREANVSDVLGSNVPVTTSQITAGNTSDVTISPQNGTLVAGSAFTSADGLTVVVTSNAHGLVAGQVVTTTASTVAGYNGTHKITAVTTNTFTYVMTVAGTIGSGTISYTKQGVVKITANEVISNNLYVDGSSAIGGSLNVTGNVNFNTTEAIKIPVGTTGQRPSVPVQGQIRFNTTTSTTEVYKGASWESVGGSPFDASGGNITISPDPIGTTPLSATFTSIDGLTVIVAYNNHSIQLGTTIRISTVTSGYSGDWIVTSKTTNTFTYIMQNAVSPTSGTPSCTYLRAGNYKIHIYTTSGTFTVGNKSSGVEVLVVGGGGGAVQGGGGGGAVVYSPYSYVGANQTLNVLVGSGGSSGSSGTASVFNGLTANGGLSASGKTGGASGSGSLGTSSQAGGIEVISGSAYYGGAYYSAGGGGSTFAVGENGKSQLGGSSGSAQSAVGGIGGCGYGSAISGKLDVYGAGGNGTAVSGPYTYSFGLTHGTINNTIYGCGGNGSGGSGTQGIVIIRYPYWIS